MAGSISRKSLKSELAAARAVAAKAELAPVTPEVLKLAEHTTVRLAPLPIVARIRSGGAIDRLFERLAHELAVAKYLAARGAPAVRPTSAVDAGPYVHDGCAMTFWDLVAGQAVESEADLLLATGALRQLHRVLEAYDGDLPTFVVAFESCGSILSDPAETPNLAPSDRLFLQRLYARLREELDGREFVCRPIHGDTHLANVLITESGAIWMDLEAVCTGPLEWDVVNLPRSAWTEFEEIDASLMRFLADIRSLCVATWCWADFDRSAEVTEAAIHHLDRLRSRFG